MKRLKTIISVGIDHATLNDRCIDAFKVKHINSNKLFKSVEHNYNT
jgi:hypothetical protein